MGHSETSNSGKTFLFLGLGGGQVSPGGGAGEPPEGWSPGRPSPDVLPLAGPKTAQSREGMESECPAPYPLGEAGQRDLTLRLTGSRVTLESEGLLKLCAGLCLPHQSPKSGLSYWPKPTRAPTREARGCTPWGSASWGPGQASERKRMDLGGGGESQRITGTAVLQVMAPNF